MYQLKSIQIMLEEVLQRHIREEQERKVMEEFYKPAAQAHSKKNSRLPKESKELERVGEIDEGEASND